MQSSTENSEIIAPDTVAPSSDSPESSDSTPTPKKHPKTPKPSKKTWKQHLFDTLNHAFKRSPKRTQQGICFMSITKASNGGSNDPRVGYFYSLSDEQMRQIQAIINNRPTGLDSKPKQSKQSTSDST